MKFLITGVSLRSKGGEAMVLETHRMIKKIHASNDISMLSDNPEYDSFFFKHQSGMPDVLVHSNKPKKHGDHTLINYLIQSFIALMDFSATIVNRLFSRRISLKIPYYSPLYKQIDSCDCVLQIAGISFSSDFGRISAFGWMHQMVIAFLMQKKYFCLPQSIGPSTDWFINLCAKIGLNRVSSIMPRGVKSIQYLDTVHIKKPLIQFVPDLAFSFPNPGKDDGNIIVERYGIDPSRKYFAVLFNTHLYNWGGDRTILMICNIIDWITEKYDYHAILIAHEVNDQSKIDDRYVNELIWENCARKEKIIIIKDDLRANEIKSLLKCCEFSLCSRFHAMISSLKVGIIPIVIGWADKYYEIMELFHLEHLVLRYENCQVEDIKRVISSVLSRKAEIIIQIQSNLSKYDDSSEKMRKIIEQNLLLHDHNAERTANHH